MKVLLTTDGSESAEQSIRWFSRLPILHSRSYEIVTAASYQVFGMAPAEVHEEFFRLDRAYSLESFQRAAAILKEVGLEAVHANRIGQPADEITQYAKSSNEDAPLRITIASDCSDADSQIATQIKALGLPKHTKVQLVSVIEHPYLLEPVFEYDEIVTRETALAMDRLAKKLESSSVNIEKHVFEKVHVGSCILDFVQKHPTDIIVMGDKGRSAIGRFFLGSVSRFILHHAPCSVLLVRKRVD